MNSNKNKFASKNKQIQEQKPTELTEELKHSTDVSTPPRVNAESSLCMDYFFSNAKGFVERAVGMVANAR